jgi:hypothetical protein
MVVAALVLVLLAFSDVPALARAEGPQWSVSGVARPSGFVAGARPGEDAFVVFVTNSGGSATSAGEVVTITDELPAGVSPAGGISAEDELGVTEGGLAGGEAGFSKDCGPTGNGGVSCSFAGIEHVGANGQSECPGSGGVGSARCIVPDETLIVTFPVTVTAGAGSSLGNVVRVSSAGAPAAVVQSATGVFGSEGLAREGVGFGVAAGGASTSLSSVQAGAHPDITTTFAFNTENSSGATIGNLKNIVAYEPPGVSLDPLDTPACEADLFLREECPVATQVGVTTLIADQYGDNGTPNRYLEPVYDLAPEPGQIAKIGFFIGQFRYEGDISVRPPGEEDAYGGKVVFYNATGGPIDYDGGALTLWGVPASAVHNPLRWSFVPKEVQSTGHYGSASTATEAPFFTNPTACAGELESSFAVDSWQEPGRFLSTGMRFGPIVGCDRLRIEPSLTAEVTSDSAYAPTGFDLATKVPQAFGDPEALAAPAVQTETVKLPEGMTLNPSSSAGLEACSEAQYEQEGVQYVSGGGCPNESRLASVKIKLPILDEEVTGSVFLAEPAPRGEAGKNPFDSLLALYLVARIPNRGVLVKAPGLVELNQSTGQITTKFGLPNALEPEGGLPPVQFSLATFAFNQGANAPLVTPPTCGDYEVQAELSAWSDPGVLIEPPIPPFAITTNCPAGGIPPFNPQVIAGTDNNDAGAFSPLYLRISREDGEQEITGFATQFPPGLTGDLSGVERCSEADVQRAREQTGVEAEEDPACPAGSEIGHSIAEAGVGSVLVQTPGRIYLGEEYEGAPFSVVSVTSAVAGPFDLGTVVVHFPLQINPETAQVSIPEGPADQIPHIIKGIVIHVRNIRAYISRERFMLNPTSCNPLSLSATVVGGGVNPTDPADNDPVTVSDPFQAADCANLAFTPTFKVSTGGHASKAKGAGLVFKIAYPAGAIGSQSWFNEAKFDIPKQLPARLTTLQKACLAATFETNRAACPAASMIGHAIVHTPILPVPLEGPVYFVSYGGAKFPDAVLLLKGYGITIELHGETFIDNKTGVTSATFRSLPDVPFESIEVSVPTGPYSEFGVNLPTKDKYSFCGQKLTMPTLFKASNGLEIHQDTPVTVTGCPKTKKTKKNKKSSHAKHSKKTHG